jgi:dTDP-4-dehydrorhamnose 3,5-epimerase
VRCTRGSIFDVMVDLRPDSSTFLQWVSEVLTPDNGKMMYVPKGFAHGFLTLEDDTMVSYQVSEFYAPDYYMGVRWDDPLLRIEWPSEVTTISERDQNWKLCRPEQFQILMGIKEIN